ncbi:MAG: SufD family Fe-S cluster assembly protein [Rikenellaceae bacterium]
MERFLKYLESQELSRLASEGDCVIDYAASEPLHIVIDPTHLNLKVVSSDGAARLIVVRTNAVEGGEVNISVENGAQLSMLEVLFEGAKGETKISQGESSELQATLLEMESSKICYRVDLDGRGADSKVDMLQMVTAKDHSSIDITISHNVSDCTSRSLSKCIASGESKGEFHGLVYVAQDAQRTLSEQNSRNVSLSDGAHIIAEPQLEIYADDVKCSHGATVGQMNDEAVYYMMQRGLSEDQARKLQLDGFVSEVTSRCAISGLCEALSEMVRERLGEL